MTDWMGQLAEHYRSLREKYPDEKLLIMFDIDGTIVDTRYIVLYVLRAYDRAHGTRHFVDLTLRDINVHENRIADLLERLDLSPEDRIKVEAWYFEHQWSSEAILNSHRPFNGVLGVIRWFQLQPDTYVALNTGRPESVRKDTLHSLNALGRAYRVHFDNALLHMNTNDWEVGVTNAKVAGVERFRNEGYRVIAFIDNEPENIQAVAKADTTGEIMVLHANTLFETMRGKIPKGTPRGENYDLTELITEKDLPERIQFVWHGVNDAANLRQFLASEVHWAEVDVRIDPRTGVIVSRHDAPDSAKATRDDINPSVAEILRRIREHRRCVKIDFKQGGELVARVLALLAECGFDDDSVWFNGNVERLEEEGYRALRAAHPNAIIQCPVDFLAPLIVGVPDKAKEIIDIFRGWGINRFSIGWRTPNKHALFDQMDTWGFDVNVYDVPDLESFLEAVLLVPRSVTSDFNFPKWHYYGQGSGEEGEHIEYSMRQQRGGKR